MAYEIRLAPEPRVQSGQFGLAELHFFSSVVEMTKAGTEYGSKAHLFAA
jgi:hypothetical protein